MRLESSVVLITGAGRGIGKILAQHFCEAGAAVMLNFPDESADARDTADALSRAGGQARAVRGDVSVVADARAIVDETIRAFGRVDVLVNNAAIDPTVGFLDVTEDLFDRVIDTNVKGAYFCAQAAARSMRASGGGRIINISSVHSRTSLPGCSVYAASKGALESLTRQLAIDLSPFGITVNAIAPGPIEVEKFVADPAYDRAALAAEIPAGRVGSPRDVSAAALFFASGEAAWITGQVLTVDGGTTSRLPLYVGRPIPGGPTPSQRSPSSDGSDARGRPA
jgi:NAD(P)-dependent dehydrogenase (short-subunit alcohol dehydrogenase family)